MPSVKHEAVTQVLRNEPQLIPLLLQNLGVRFPAGASVMIADTNLSERDPGNKKVYLSDNVFVFESDEGKIAVVAEIQTKRPRRSQLLSWPAYTCNARSVHDCDAVLAVFAITRDAALGCAQMNFTGHPGFNLRPLMTGWGRMPGPGGARFGPELTVLHVITGDLDLTSHEARMFALMSIAAAPPERRESYTRYIRAVIPPAASEAVEELVKAVIKDPFIDAFIAKGEAEGLAKGLAEGRAQGRAEGEAQLLLRYLGSRFKVPARIRDRVTACTDTARLEAWFDRAITAATLDEVFAE